MNWIKWNRERLGITQEQLAKELGFSRTLVTKWETARASVTVENTKILCQYFKIDEESILSPEYIEEILDKRKKGIRKDIYLSVFVLAICIAANIAFAVNVAFKGFNVNDPWNVFNLVFLCLSPLWIFQFGSYFRADRNALKDQRIMLIGYLRNKVLKSERDELYKCSTAQLKEKLITLKNK